MKKENYWLAEPIMDAIQSAEKELSRTESLIENRDYLNQYSGDCGTHSEVSKINIEAKRHHMVYLKKRLKKFIAEQESKLAKL